MRFRVVVALVFGFLVLAGCGDDAREQDGGLPDAAELDAGGFDVGELCMRVRDSELGLCELAFDVVACQRRIERDPSCDGLRHAIEDGRIAYDGVVAEACIDENADMPPSSALLECARDVFTGLRDNGDDCYTQYPWQVNECADGFCDLTSGQCPSTCRPYRQDGDECGPSDYCAEGLHCQFSLQPHARCTPLSQNGERCFRFDECLSRTCINGVCADRPEPECETDADCDDDEVCTSDDGEEFLGATCQPAMAEAERGRDGDACMPFGCDEAFFCDGPNGSLNGMCRADRGHGDDCAELYDGFGNPSCEVGLYCLLGSTNTCLPPGKLGEPCAYDEGETCEAGLACTGQGSTVCEEPSELGEECAPAFLNACSEGFCACVENHGDNCGRFECAPLREDGAPCESAQECDSGFCNDQMPEPACSQPPPIPAPCVPCADSPECL